MNKQYTEQELKAIIKSSSLGILTTFHHYIGLMMLTESNKTAQKILATGESKFLAMEIVKALSNIIAPMESILKDLHQDEEIKKLIALCVDFSTSLDILEKSSEGTNENN